MRSTHDIAESLTSNRLDDLSGPVDVGAVLPFLTRVEEQRCRERRFATRDHAGLPMFLREPVVRLVEEVVAEPGV